MAGARAIDVTDTGWRWKPAPGDIAEATWLIVLVALPLAFNPFSVRGGEFEKALLLHSAGILLFGLLLARGFSRDELAAAGRKPVCVAAALVGLTHALSTLMSVAPAEALLGSFSRAQGLTTLLSWLVLFVALTTWARTQGVRERILSVIVLASIPVCAYGLLQRGGWDPLPWSVDMSARCSSTLGNPVFLGGYLAMLLTPTVYLAARSWERRKATPGTWCRLPWVVAAFVLQVVTLWATGSRGPLSGGLAGMGLFLGLEMALRGLRRRAVAWLGGGMLAALVLLATISGEPGRMRATVMRGETIRIRVVLWESVAHLLASREPVARHDGRADRFHALRPWIGYGPECLAWVYDPFYPAELGRLEKKAAIPDRAHNEMLDALITTGMAGLVATWLMYGALFHAALKTLRGKRGRGDESSAVPDASERLMAAALVSGIVAHDVDIQFGFRTLSTGTLFWVFCAMLATPCQESAGHISPDRPRHREWMFRAAVWAGGAAALAWLCVRPLGADILFTRGLRARETGDFSQAIRHMERATLLQPWEETIFSELGKSRYVQALSEQGSHFDARMAQALGDLQRARRLNPLRSENSLHLAGVYTGWAALSREPDKREYYAGQAEACFAEAARISPNRSSIWVERAMLHLNVLEDPNQAEAFLLQAVRLDPNDPASHAWLGHHYESMAAQESDEEEREAVYRLALRHYEWAADLAKEGYHVTRLHEIHPRMIHLFRLLGNEEWAGIYETEARKARTKPD